MKAFMFNLILVVQEDVQVDVSWSLVNQFDTSKLFLNAL